MHKDADYITVIHLNSVCINLHVHYMIYDTGLNSFCGLKKKSCPLKSASTVPLCALDL